MTSPYDVLEEALRVAEVQHKQDNDPTSKYWGFRLYAKAAVEVLTSSEIVAAAVAALKDDGWEETHEGPHGIGTLSDEDLANIARTVLRSVGGAQ